MESMTGYGVKEKQGRQFSFSIELKSLNSKYVETHINIPKFLKSEENIFQDILKKNFSRGKLELNIDVFGWQEKKSSILNGKLLESYYKELLDLKKDLKIETDTSLESLLTLDGILKKDRVEISKSSLKEINEVIKEVVKKTVEMRKKEGVSVKKDIINSLSFISKSVTKIKKLSKDVVVKKKESLLSKIQKISDVKIDNSRIMTEIAIMSDKLDVNEEIVRLTDHLKKFKEIIKESGQIGRKLDFLGQELFREINTIASKSSNSEISHIVVDVKNHIDKIREQCRNIV